MQILNHQQQMQQQMAAEKMQEPRMQRPPLMQNAPNPNQPAPQPPHQTMMSQSMADGSVAQPPQVQPNAPARKKIWSGILEWFKKEKNTPADKVPQQVPCYVTAKEGDPEMYCHFFHILISYYLSIVQCIFLFYFV